MLTVYIPPKELLTFTTIPDKVSAYTCFENLPMGRILTSSEPQDYNSKNVVIPIPQTNSSIYKDILLSLSEYQSSKDPIGVGIPCQWLKKPKNSEKCKSDARYTTCWKKYPYWRK